MRFKNLESVVLKRDLPDDGLRAGDVGTVVETYDPDGLEVEFLAASGDTLAVLTLNTRDVRKATPRDVLAVRSSRTVA